MINELYIPIETLNYGETEKNIKTIELTTKIEKFIDFLNNGKFLMAKPLSSHSRKKIHFFYANVKRIDMVFFLNSRKVKFKFPQSKIPIYKHIVEFEDFRLKYAIFFSDRNCVDLIQNSNRTIETDQFLKNFEEDKGFGYSPF